MKHLSLRYFLLTLSMTFFYNIILPFVADARYVCQHCRLGSHTLLALLHGPGNHLACVVSRCSGKSSMSMAHRCSFVIVKNVCLTPSKFFLDKFSSYGRREANNVAGAIYISALVFATVAGCLIVRIWMRVWNGGARLRGLTLCCFQDFVGLRGIILLICAILMLPVLTVLAFTNVPPLICTISMGIINAFVVVSFDPVLK